MKKILFLFVALSVCSCKARKVSLEIVDSNTKTKTNTQVSKQTETVDTGKINTHTEVTSVDSSQYEVTVETGGKVINIKDGNFTGPADKVHIKGKKNVTAKAVETKQEQKGRSENTKLDSAAQVESETTVKKKKKDTEAKPDYSWLLWLAGGMLIFFVGAFFYIRKVK